MARNIVKRLRFSKYDARRIVKLVRWHQFSMDERQTDKALRRFIRNIGQENIEAMLALRVGDRKGGGARETSWRFELFRKRLVEVQKIPFTVHDLAIDGKDVMETLKIKPGKKVGEVLNNLFDKIDDGKLKK